VRVLYGKDKLSFNEKWVTQIKKKCCFCAHKDEEPVYVYRNVSAAEQNLKFEIEKVIIHFHGGAFVAHTSFQHSSYTRQWAN
jgi:acetyl esterase/lipase